MSADMDTTEDEASRSLQPAGTRRAFREGAPTLLSEADARLARKALRIQHAGECEQNVSILRLQGERTRRTRVQRLLEGIRAPRRHQHAQDLAAVEPDLDARELVLASQWKPPP